MKAVVFAAAFISLVLMVVISVFSFSRHHQSPHAIEVMK
jgi:hypothetical protein